MLDRRGGVKGRVGLAEKERMRWWEGGGQQRAQRSERGLPGGACVEGTTSDQFITVEPAEPVCSLSGSILITAGHFSSCFS